MVELNRQNYVSGNTVLVPQYDPSKKHNEEKYKKLQKAKKEAQIKLRKQQTKQKLAIMKMISFVLVVGVFLLLRYTAIYKMQADLQSYKTQVSNIHAQNESLKLTLAQSANINSVEEIAVNDLHMVRANASDVITVDLSKNNFKAAKVNIASNSIVDKLKNILFWYGAERK